MDRENIREQQLFIIDGQLAGSILYIASLVFAIIIVLDQRKKALEEEGFLTNHMAQLLALFNRIFILLLIFWFIYLNYKSRNLAQDTNQSTNSLDLQIIAAVITVVPALINLYVTATNFQDSSLQPAEIENPFV